MKHFQAGDVLRVTAYGPKEVETPYVVIEDAEDGVGPSVVVYSFEIGGLIAALTDAAVWIAGQVAIRESTGEQDSEP